MTRFTVNRTAFASALAFVEKRAAQDNRIPIIAQVRIEVSGQQVSLTATNTDQAAKCAIEVTPNETGATCVPATLLLRAIKSVASDSIEFSDDGRNATVIAGKSKFKFPVLPASDFPEMSMLYSDGEAEFILGSDVLSSVSDRVAFAVEPVNGRVALTGVSWAMKRQNEIEICATDGLRLALMKVQAPLGSSEMPSIIVPAIDIPEWDGDVLMTISRTFVRLQCGSQVFATKLIDATYPEYQRVIPSNNIPLLFDRQEMLAALARVSLVADARESSVLFVGRNGKISISVDTQLGCISDEIAYSGEDFQIAITHKIAISTLQKFDCEVIEWRYRDHQTGVTIHDRNDDQFLAYNTPYRDRRLVEYITTAQEAA